MLTYLVKWWYETESMGESMRGADACQPFVGAFVYCFALPVSLAFPSKCCVCSWDISHAEETGKTSNGKASRLPRAYGQWLPSLFGGAVGNQTVELRSVWQKLPRYTVRRCAGLSTVLKPHRAGAYSHMQR